MGCGEVGRLTVGTLHEVMRRSPQLGEKGRVLSRVVDGWKRGGSCNGGAWLVKVVVVVKEEEQGEARWKLKQLANRPKPSRCQRLTRDKKFAVEIYLAISTMAL